jgi:hypothetical protein
MMIARIRGPAGSDLSRRWSNLTGNPAISQLRPRRIFAILPLASERCPKSLAYIHVKATTQSSGHCETGRRTSGQGKNQWVWATLGAILVLYVFCTLIAKPKATFGVFLDDGLYFSAAKGLANGQGYILPSFPGHLTATKYPELYPLLLAGVWELDPHFPGNIKVAVGLTQIFGCGFLIIAFLMLRDWPELGEWEALSIVGLCGFSSLFLYMSGCVMSDIPFLAVALAGIWLAEHSLHAKDHSSAEALAAGLFVGLSIGIRSLGIPIAAGIGLVMLLRRRYRQLIWYCASGLPLALAWAWPTISLLFGGAGAGVTLPTQQIVQSGWTQTLCYYSSYACNWREGVNSLASLLAVIRVNLTVVGLQPGLYLLSPLAGQAAALPLLLLVLASALAYAGIIRTWRLLGWGPIHGVFLCYLLVVVPSPYGIQRYLLLFLPLFFGGIWIEGRLLVSLLIKGMKSGSLRRERAVAGILALAGLVVAATAVTNYVFAIPAGLRKLGDEHQKVLQAEKDAYEWIRKHTAPTARVISFQDGLTYLYTGRQSIWPIAPLPQSFFQHDPSFARHDADHLADVAEHVGASYWLVSPYDANFEDPGGFAIVQARQKRLLSGAPVVYRSPGGLVLLYDVRHQ